MNPLDESLEGKTDFTVRYSVSFDVKVEDLPSTGNGLSTGVRRAEEKVERRLGWILAAPATGLRQGHQHHGPHDVCLHFNEFEDLDDSATVIDPKWRKIKGRLFDRMIHLGLGDYSGRGGAVLSERLDEALCHLGGLQQGACDEEGDKYIEDVVRDVAMALTGKEIILVQDENR